jgi:hypothetical protein
VPLFLADGQSVNVTEIPHCSLNRKENSATIPHMRCSSARVRANRLLLRVLGRRRLGMPLTGILLSAFCVAAMAQFNGAGQRPYPGWSTFSEQTINSGFLTQALRPGVLSLVPQAAPGSEPRRPLPPGA